MTTTTPRRRTLLVSAVVGIAALVSGCGSDDGASSGGSVKVTGAWARSSAAMQNAGAAYMMLENTSDKADALVKVAIDASVTKTVELHETVAAEGGMTATTAMGGSATTAAMGGSATTGMGGGMGAMSMRPVAKIVVPAKGTAELKPGGYHVMLLDLAKPLVKGESFEATLTFESGATTKVKVEVRDQA